jgi:hypothetical protein
VAVNYYPTKKQGEGLSISERIHYCNIPFFRDEAGVFPPSSECKTQGLEGWAIWTKTLEIAHKPNKNSKRTMPDVDKKIGPG